MFRPAARPYPNPGLLAWAAVAVLLGVVIAFAPLMVVGGGLGLVAVGLVVLVEPALGLVLMLGVAPLKTLIATEASIPVPVDVGQASFALAVGAWLIWRITRRRWSELPRTRLYWPLIAIMLGFGPSLFEATSSGAWLSEIVKWIEMLLLVLIVLDLEHDHRWEWIVFGVSVGAALQALIGLYEYSGGSGAAHLWLPDYRHFRAFGTFGQPNPFSAFMGLSLPLALGLAWGYASKVFTAWRAGEMGGLCAVAAWWRNSRWQGLLRAIPVEVSCAVLALWYAGVSLLLLAGLIVSWGRGAWLGFGAAATVMVFFAPPKRWQGVLLLGLGGVFFATLWLVGYLPPGIEQRINNAITEFVGFGDMRGVPVSDENFAIVERLAHWQAAYNMAGDHPFIGVGLGNYEVVYHDYAIPSWPRALGHAHNDYLNLLAETGLVGLAGYLLGWSAIIYWTVRALRQSDVVMRGLVVGLLGTWTHLAVHSMVDKLYVNNLFLTIGVMLGLLAVAYRSHRSYR
ncbi:MAG: O-antigen ligase family protein [Anaerolineae bacterium]|nr:O-antigen ligase family protein [Anaerolineae bacterium]